MKIEDFDEGERKSYANEMSETDHKMCLQILDEKKATLNMFKVNLAFLLIIITMVLYFIFGPNFILTWYNIPKTNLSIEISLFSFKAKDSNISTPFNCFDYYNQCKLKSASPSPSCHNSPILNIDNSLKVECSSLHQLYIIGIIFISVLVIGLLINVISIASIVSLFLNKDQHSEKGIFLSKFEFVFYFIASIEYAFHLLAISGNFDYRYYVMIIYCCGVMSFLNILFIRKAFYKFLVLKARSDLTRLSQVDFLELLQDKNFK